MVFLFSIGCWSQSLSNGGGWSGSGGDTNLFKDNVWFFDKVSPYHIVYGNQLIITFPTMTYLISLRSLLKTGNHFSINMVFQIKL